MTQQNQIVRILEVGVSQVNINHRDLGLAIAALAQDGARRRVAAAAPTALTDSSTGTAAATGLGAVSVPVQSVKDGVTAFSAKAAFDTEIGLIEDGHQELVSKTNELIVLIASAAARKVQTLTLAAAANNTIAAIAPATTGATTNLTAAASGTAQIVNARNNQAAIMAGINYCKVALGLPPVTDGSGGVFTVSASTYPTGAAAATAAAVTANGAAVLTLASVNAALAALTNNVATMAAALNQMRGTLAIGPFVVATSNPRTRFLPADITV